MNLSDIIESVSLLNQNYKEELQKEESLLKSIESISSLQLSFPEEFLYETTIADSRPTSEIDIGLGFIGLNRHKRCFYLKHNDWYIGFKGVSFLYPIEKSKKAGALYPLYQSELIQEFVEREHEIPYGMTMSSCIEDYEAPLHFCSEFIKKYGYLPSVPYPLMILKLKETDVVKKNKELLLELAPDTSKELLLDFFFKQELGVYVYAFKGSPVRVGHL